MVSQDRKLCRILHISPDFGDLRGDVGAPVPLHHGSAGGGGRRHGVSIRIYFF